MKGILMKPWKIEATAKGLATATRRSSGLKEINLEPNKWKLYPLQDADKRYYTFFDGHNFEDTHEPLVFCKPRYQVGEVVYIKEAHFIGGIKPNEWVIYKDSKLPVPRTKVEDYVWCSPLFMPAWAARHFVKILSNDPQRLQEITEEEAVAEGTPINDFFPITTAMIAGLTTVYFFADLWNEINPDYPFESNPWVFRYEYMLLEK